MTAVRLHTHIRAKLRLRCFNGFGFRYLLVVPHQFPSSQS